MPMPPDMWTQDTAPGPKTVPPGPCYLISHADQIALIDLFKRAPRYMRKSVVRETTPSSASVTYESELQILARALGHGTAASGAPEIPGRV